MSKHPQHKTRSQVYTFTNRSRLSSPICCNTNKILDRECVLHPLRLLGCLRGKISPHWIGWVRNAPNFVLQLVQKLSGRRVDLHSAATNTDKRTKVDVYMFVYSNILYIYALYMQRANEPASGFREAVVCEFDPKLAIGCLQVV